MGSGGVRAWASLFSEGKKRGKKGVLLLSYLNNHASMGDGSTMAEIGSL